MKNFLTSFLLLAALTAGAQTQPNRLLVNSGQDRTGYSISRVDSISFATIEGDVKANVTFQRFATGDTGDTLWLSVQRTPQCVSFSIDVLPTNTANRYNTDEIIASYFAQQDAQRYTQDFTSAQMTGFPTPFVASTSYTVVTMGYDQYGVACQADRAEFTTPGKPLVGNPSVTWTLDDVQATQFTLTVTPNADCQEFYWCQFNKGEAQQQFEQWGPMFGFANMGDMIKQFSGEAHTERSTNTWNGLKPRGEYEVYVLPVDAEGTYADMVVVPVTTAAMGGEGTATVTITTGDFGGDATNGYWQYVSFTPNDQAGIHHDLIMTKEYYDANYTDATILDVLKSETNPFNPYDTYWDQTGVDAGQWGANPSTAYYALSLAQNAKGEWGPLAKLAYTTPSSPTASAPLRAVSPRLSASFSASKKAVAPKFQVGKATLQEVGR